MNAFLFSVEQRSVSGQHQHTWVAIDNANGFEIDLPKGGTGAFLGRYPEIANYLIAKGHNVALDYSRQRGDTFEADHTQSIYTWTFNTGGTIVVKDIPRLVFGISVQI